MPRFSTSQAAAGSTREMAEVQAAKTSRMKKRVPNSSPPGIWPKAMGRVMKTSPGPAPGSMPLAKTMGKMARPASKETRVSSPAISREEFRIEALRGR